MIDIETLATSERAVVLSIGACQFSLAEARIVESNCFYVTLGAESQKNREIDPSTVIWWMRQDSRAREEWIDSKKPLANGLAELSGWLQLNKVSAVWANSPTFDLTILRHAYVSMGFPVPWHFRDERDVRTLVQMGKLAGVKKVSDAERRGVAHNALDDAKHQASYCIELWRALRRS